jgi:hypothetical protein
MLLLCSVKYGDYLPGSSFFVRLGERSVGNVKKLSCSNFVTSGAYFVGIQNSEVSNVSNVIIIQLVNTKSSVGQHGA